MYCDENVTNLELFRDSNLVKKKGVLLASSLVAAADVVDVDGTIRWRRGATGGENLVGNIKI